MRYFSMITLCLAGCATAHPERSNDQVRNTYLVCGSTVRLDISHDGRAAVIREGDRPETVLQRTVSTLGTRYAGDGVSVLRSGDTYIYTDRDGDTIACDLLPR